MRVFIADNGLKEDFDRLLDMGITWTEYRVWRKLYEALTRQSCADMTQQSCLEIKDTEAAILCRVERMQYRRAVKGLVGKGIIQSLGENEYYFGSSDKELPLCAQGKIDVQKVLRDNYNKQSNDFPF